MTYLDLSLSGYSFGIAAPANCVTVRPKLTTLRIKEAVCDFYNLPLIEMVSARQQRHVARPRQIAMYLTRELTPKSLPAIGRQFGGRDHTTVIHAVKTIKRLMWEDADFASDVETLRERLA